MAVDLSDSLVSTPLEEQVPDSALETACHLKSHGREFPVVSMSGVGVSPGVSRQLALAAHRRRIWLLQSGMIVRLGKQDLVI